METLLNSASRNGRPQTQDEFREYVAGLADKAGSKNGSPSSAEPPSRTMTTPLPWCPGTPLRVSLSSLLAAGMGDKFVGMDLDGVQTSIRPHIELYLRRLPEMVSAGYGIALTGRQGTGKTAIMAILAEAMMTTLPLPERAPGQTSLLHQVRYVRMPRLVRMLGDFLPASERVGWETWYRELLRCRMLMIDEFANAPDDRGCTMLIDLIDERLSAHRPTIVAMNARWDELTADDSTLLRQLREKLEGVTREVPIPGGSRRKGW